MSTVFSESFEGGGNGAALTAVNTAYNSFTNGTPVFDTGTFVGGATSAKFAPTLGSSLTIKQVYAGSVTHRFIRRYFRLNALPGAGTVNTLLRTRLSSTSTGQVVVGSSGTIQIRDVNTTVATSTNAVAVNTWFRIEWEVNGTGTATQNCRLFLGANFNGTTPDETLTGAYTSGAFDRTEEGIGGASSGALWMDEAVDDNATWPGPVAGGNQAPTAIAGTDQSVTSAQLVTLDGTVSSDSDGTIASYAWTQLTGTTVTLSNSAAVQPTFTAPTVTGSPSTLSFGLVVTDNLGAQSAQDSVIITVNPPAATAFSEDFENGTLGAAVDNLNSGYSSFNGTPTFDNTAIVSGTLSGKMVSDGTTSQSFTQALPSSATTRYMRRYFRFAALPVGGMTLIRTRVNATTATTAQVVLNSSGLFQIRDGNTGVATSTTAVTLNTWVRLEWGVDGTTTNTQTLKIFVLGNYNGSTASETVSGAYTNGSFDRVIDGLGTALYNGTAWIDGIADDTSSYVGPMVSANAAPTANAGPNQTVDPSVTVTLDATASSDSNGTIQGYRWTQTSGLAVTLSSSTAAQPTFTSPSGGTAIIFSLVVIDDKGAGSTPDTVTITVNAAAIAFNESFEGGSNGATLTTSNTTFNAITSTPVFDNTQFVAGSQSAKLVATGSTISVREIMGSTTTSRYIRCYFRFTAWAAAGNVVAIYRVRDSSGTTKAQIAMGSGGQLQVRDTGNVTVATSSTIMPLNQWVRLEWFIDGTTTNTQTFRIYTGNLLNSPVTVTEQLSGAYTGGSFDRVEEGVSSTLYNGTMWLDEAQDRVSSWPGPATGANQPPIVNAGSGQNVLPGDTVTLDGTGSTDNEAPIASYAWTQVLGTSVTLSSSTAAQPTFTAPALDSGDTLTFHLVVTDSGGITSQIGTVSITVQPANEFVLKSGTWQPAPPTLM